MPVSIDGTEIASFTIVLVKGGIYVNQWSFTDDTGNPIPILDASIVVEPTEPTAGATETWDTSNGRFTQISSGVWLLDLDVTYINSVTWTAGKYHVAVVEPSGFPDPCITGGLVFATEC